MNSNGVVNVVHHLIHISLLVIHIGTRYCLPIISVSVESFARKYNAEANSTLKHNLLVK
jgi:hypothetical protein